MKNRLVLLDQAYILAILLFVNLFVFIYVFANTLRDLLQIWLKFDQSLGHGLLVIATTIFLIYKAIDWKSDTVLSDYRAALPLAALSFIWGIAYSVDINLAEQLLLPVILFFSIQLLLGISIAKKLVLPIFLLYFSIPVWDHFNGVLLSVTVAVVQWLVRISNITAYIEGTSIFLASGEILIAEGCSGLRYFVIALFLSILSGYLYFRSFKTRILIVLLGVFLSLIANWLRVYLIIVIGYLSEMQSSLVSQHELMGWIVFVIFMTPIFYINNKYQQTGVTNDAEEYRDGVSISKTGSNRILIALCLFILCTSVGPFLLLSQTLLLYNKSSTETSIPPATEFRPDNKYSSKLSWMSAQLYYKEHNNYVYTNNNININAVVFDFIKQKQYGEILPYIASIHDTKSWSIESIDIVSFKYEDGHVVLNKMIITSKYENDRIVVFYKYKVGEFSTTSYVKAKLFQIPANLIGQKSGSLVILYSHCTNSCDREAHALSDVIVNHINFLD